MQAIPASHPGTGSLSFGSSCEVFPRAKLLDLMADSPILRAIHSDGAAMSLMLSSGCVVMAHSPTLQSAAASVCTIQTGHADLVLAQQVHPSSVSHGLHLGLNGAGQLLVWQEDHKEAASWKLCCDVPVLKGVGGAGKNVTAARYFPQHKMLAVVTSDGALYLMGLDFKLKDGGPLEVLLDAPILGRPAAPAATASCKLMPFPDDSGFWLVSHDSIAWWGVMPEQSKPSSAVKGCKTRMLLKPLSKPARDGLLAYCVHPFTNDLLLVTSKGELMAASVGWNRESPPGSETTATAGIRLEHVSSLQRHAGINQAAANAQCEAAGLAIVTLVQQDDKAPVLYWHDIATGALLHTREVESSPSQRVHLWASTHDGATIVGVHDDHIVHKAFAWPLAASALSDGMADSGMLRPAEDGGDLEEASVDHYLGQLLRPRLLELAAGQIMNSQEARVDALLLHLARRYYLQRAPPAPVGAAKSAEPAGAFYRGFTPLLEALEQSEKRNTGHKPSMQVSAPTALFALNSAACSSSLLLKLATLTGQHRQSFAARELLALIQPFLPKGPASSTASSCTTAEQAVSALMSDASAMKAFAKALRTGPGSDASDAYDGGAEGGIDAEHKMAVFARLYQAASAADSLELPPLPTFLGAMFKVVEQEKSGSGSGTSDGGGENDDEVEERGAALSSALRAAIAAIRHEPSSAEVAAQLILLNSSQSTSNPAAGPTTSEAADAVRLLLALCYQAATSTAQESQAAWNKALALLADAERADDGFVVGVTPHPMDGLIFAAPATAPAAAMTTLGQLAEAGMLNVTSLLQNQRLLASASGASAKTPGRRFSTALSATRIGSSSSLFPGRRSRPSSMSQLVRDSGKGRASMPVSSSSLRAPASSSSLFGRSKSVGAASTTRGRWTNASARRAVIFHWLLDCALRMGDTTKLEQLWRRAPCSCYPLAAVLATINNAILTSPAASSIPLSAVAPALEVLLALQAKDSEALGRFWKRRGTEAAAPPASLSPAPAAGGLLSPAKRNSRVGLGGAAGASILPPAGDALRAVMGMGEGFDSGEESGDDYLDDAGAAGRSSQAAAAMNSTGSTGQVLREWGSGDGGRAAAGAGSSSTVRR